MKFENLPNNILRTIVEMGSVKNAGVWKTVSKDMKRIVEETKHEKNLPVPKPDYSKGTGKYQAQYDDLSSLTVLDLDYSDSVLRAMTMEGLLELYVPGGIIRELKDLKKVRMFRKTVSLVVDKLNTWTSPRYKKALHLLQTRRKVTIAEDAESGHWAFDAVVMVLHDMYKRDIEYKKRTDQYLRHML